MADALENAIRDTGRVPNLVLSGHVHDYQRIEQNIAPDGPTPFIVSGNGGYHNLHQIHSANGTVAADTKAKLIYGKVSWGYLTLTIDKKSISGQSTEIDRTGKITTPADTFSYPIDPVILKNPKSVPTCHRSFRVDAAPHPWFKVRFFQRLLSCVQILGVSAGQRPRGAPQSDRDK
jgi:hypothetical protein